MIGILGRGKTGSGIAKVLTSSGHECRFLQSRVPEQAEQESESFDWVFLCLRPSQAASFLGSIRDSSRFIETSATKAEVRKQSGEFISIDPLFIESGKDEVVVLTDIGSAGSVSVISSLFAGYRIVPMNYQEHVDRVLFPRVCSYIMALTQLQFYNAGKSGNHEFQEVFRPPTLSSSIEAMRDTIRTSGLGDRAFLQVERNLKKTWNELSFYP
ncbi:hypothetical protein ApAK_04225 [Thermoplasmatales archaeon AK]|nr:hypothetical protein [Thermoplasmatales archaeon AK]